jgi:hypothetical protein
VEEERDLLKKTVESAISGDFRGPFSRALYPVQDIFVAGSALGADLGLDLIIFCV